jgi:hypothetical protein
MEEVYNYDLILVCLVDAVVVDYDEKLEYFD